MWRIHSYVGLPRALILMFCAPIAAQSTGSTVPQTGTERWQVRRLHYPTPAELNSETQGSVFIYENFTDRSVDNAMDTHFERIESVMFIGTIATDEDGQALIDPVTGQPVTEEDGCD